MRFTALIGAVLNFFKRSNNYFVRQYKLSKFIKKGKKIYIGENCIFTNGNIELGDNIYFGANCVIQSAHGKIKIGNNVMFGPGVHIHGGNHPIHEIGKYIKDCQKEINSDGLVNIEDDVWVGSCAIILKGVTIGKGSVIGAGSIVTKDVPPYSIYFNKIEPIIKKRFTEDELLEHERILYGTKNCET